MKNIKIRNKAFTLIELLVVVAILGLLASIVLVSVKSARSKAKIATGLQFESSVYHALGAYAVGIWDFDEGADNTCNGGEDVCDSSGNGNDGTFINAPIWRCASTDKDYTPSGDGCSLEFDGVDDYVDTGLKIKSGTRSIFFWIKYNSIASIVLMGTQEVNAYTYTGITSGGQGYSYVGNIGGTYNYFFEQGRWYFVGFSVDGVNMVKYYVNGVEVDTKTYTADNDATNNFLIGKIGAGNNINGVIDNVRIYDQALSEVQVKQLYVEGAESLGLDLAEEN